MSDLSAVSGSTYSVRIGDTLNLGVRPNSTGSSSGSGSSASGGTKVVSASQGEAAVASALKQSTAIFTQLSALQNQIQKAGSNPDKATAKALNDNIAKLSKQIDQLAASAKTNGVNLLSKDNSSVSVATASGLKVNIATQALDSKSLGLSDLNVTDAASLRAAAGKVAQAVGQTQLTVFRLQTADGAVGTATTTATAAGSSGSSSSSSAANSALSAYDKVYANQTGSSTSTSTSTNTATAAVEKALNNQIAANASGYDGYGLSTGSTSTQTNNFLNLFA